MQRARVPVAGSLGRGRIGGIAVAGYVILLVIGTYLSFFGLVFIAGSNL